MRKVFFTLSLLILLGALHAVSNYSLISNGFEPSAVNLAMGGSPIGAVNFWHNDPLNSYSNPAIMSLHSGFSYSTSGYDYLHSVDSNLTDNLKYNAAFCGITYRGIGFLAPYENQQDEFHSTRTDYGVFDIVDEEEFEGSSIHPEDIADIYGVSVNLQDFYRNFASEGRLLPENIDLAIGMNFVHNISTISLDGSSSKTDSANLGILTKAPILNRNSIFIETALGASFYNVFNKAKTNQTGSDETTIYKRANLAWGLSGAWKNKRFNAGGIPGIIENLGTMRVLAGYCDELASEPVIIGFGTELGIADMLFLRTGYHNDEAGKIKGVTYGIGINLHYRNLVGLNYNYSYFPAGSIYKEKVIEGYGLNLDIFGLIELSKIIEDL
ncbi:MAG: hypothetical protein PHO32_01395 [Candidatus Cloacimonetes bacterium]|nr:hypothetical protein [Candidatus Cloacimonadota bacterium]